MILSVEGVAYPMRFANYQRNSFVSVEIRPRWKPLWSKSYAEASERLIMAPFSIQIRENLIGVSSHSDMLVYDNSGVFKYQEGISSAAPVVFGRSAMAFLQGSLILKYQEYDQEILRDYGSLSKLNQYSFALLFKPGIEQILSVVQFTGGPHRKPPSFRACISILEDNSFVWRYDDEGIVDHAALTNDDGKMILIRGDDVYLINTENGEKSEPFKTGLDKAITASLDIKDNLIVLGENVKESEDEEDEDAEDESEKFLKVFSPDGDELWNIELRDPGVNQPPVCGSGGEIYIVDSRLLNCFKNGELQWQYLLKSSAETWLTTTQNGYIIALNGSFLTILDANGEKQYEDLFTKTDESFEAPVAVDANGRLYVAGNKKLYCFETHD
jgi:hypothetical protein